MPSVPLLSTVGPVQTLHWKAEGLLCVLDQWREDRTGIKALATITTSQPGYLPHLHESAINLASLAARATLARHLTKIATDLTDWDGWVEQMCVMALRRYRQGEPAQRLVPAPLGAGPSWRVSPLLYDKLPTVLFGPGGSRKSFVGLWLALLVECGAALGDVQAVSGRTLYLDWESDAQIASYRLGRLIDGNPDLVGAQPSYRRMTQPLAHELTSLRSLIAEDAIDVLIVDSLAMACGGTDLADPSTAVGYFSALRQLPCTSLSIAHVPKNTDNPSIYGSVFFTNIARMCWEVKCDTDEQTGTSTIGLFNRKANEKKRPPIGLHFAHDALSEAITVSAVTLTDREAFLDTSSVSAQIRHYCAHGTKTAKSLAEMMGKSIGVICMTLDRMESKGQIVRLGKGRGAEWCVPPEREEESY